MNPQEMTVPFRVVEALTWQLAAEITRRHPELWAVRTEIQYGFYNMVALRPMASTGPDISINKGSAVAIGWFGPGRPPHAMPIMNMKDYLTAEDPRAWIVELEHAAGLLPVHQGLPASTPNSLAVRWVAAFATAQINTPHPLTPETRVGWLHTDRAKLFPATADWARQISHPLPESLTIFLEDQEGEDRPAVAVSANGLCERAARPPVDLPALYREHDRSLLATLAAAAGDLLP